MNPTIDINGVRGKIAQYIKSGALDSRIPSTLMTLDGFVPKECELWDYKATANDDMVSKAKTVLQIVSFHNAYGGYILYGVAEGDSKEHFFAKGIQPKCVDEQQIRMLTKEYSGESIDFSYRELPVLLRDKEILLGILHIPKRPCNVEPVFFSKNGPEIKPGKLLFQKDQAYVRLNDNCVVAKDKKAWQFLFGARELEIDSSGNKLSLLTSKGIILDHNLPDRSVICNRFFGRDDIIERLWIWLSDEFSKTRVLAGDGGKGKTSIAFEFCEEVCRARPFDLNRVFWLTAKQRQFSGMHNEYLQMPETHFSDLPSLLHALCLGYALTDNEVDQATPRFLKKSLQNALRLFPSIVIVDDIDSVQDLDEQKRIFELCSEIASGTSSRFLLTTRMNLTFSSDVCISVPGLGKEEYNSYLSYLTSFIGCPPVGLKEVDLLWKATDGSPLFTESVLRLYKLGIPLSKAVVEWKGRLGEEVRMAALHREISKLSPEARRVLLACTYMNVAATVELKQVTGYDDARMTSCIAELTSLFLLGAPEFIEEVPRFRVPSNTARLVLETEKELVPNPGNLIKTIRNLRGKHPTKKSLGVGSAIMQAMALLREHRYDDAIKTIDVAVKRLGNNPDLILTWGRCFFAKATCNKDSNANTQARTLFKRAYDLGQRKGDLYEWWYQSESDANHHGGALEVCELAIQNGVEPKSEWRHRRALALYKLAHRHIQSSNPQEALEEFSKCVNDIVLCMSEEPSSIFNKENLREALEHVNDERVALVCRLAKNFADWEKAVETIVDLMGRGDPRPVNIGTAVEAFSKMIHNINDDGPPKKYHIAAINSRRRDIANVISRNSLLSITEKDNLEKRLEIIYEKFEATVANDSEI